MYLAGKERVEGLLEYVLGGDEAGGEGATVNVVEALTEDPLVFCIINFETAVGRHTAFL
jgi:hypothetical protein